jgi:hypothetical protein
MMEKIMPTTEQIIFYDKKIMPAKYVTFTVTTGLETMAELYLTLLWL